MLCILPITDISVAVQICKHTHKPTTTRIILLTQKLHFETQIIILPLVVLSKGNNGWLLLEEYTLLQWQASAGCL